MKIFTLCAIVFNAAAFFSLSDGQLTDPFSVTVGEEVWYVSFSPLNLQIEVPISLSLSLGVQLRRLCYG
jgi:hypothetical protein